MDRLLAAAHPKRSWPTCRRTHWSRLSRSGLLTLRPGTSRRMDETQSKYLNIVVEQDHRAIRRVACGPCSDSSPFAVHACSLPALSWCTWSGRASSTALKAQVSAAASKSCSLAL